jgi:hypothetical protein
MKLHLLDASSEADFETAFKKLTQLGASGLVIGAGSFFNNQSPHIEFGRRSASVHVKAIYMNWKYKSGGPRGYHHGNLKEALLRAALELIAQKGPAGFTFCGGRAVGGREPGSTLSPLPRSR